MLVMDYLVNFLFIAVGIYAMVGAALDVEWFMGNPKAQVFVHILGRLGTRIFYLLLGVALVVLGLWGLLD
jgi:hypothetical protein